MLEEVITYMVILAAVSVVFVVAQSLVHRNLKLKDKENITAILIMKATIFTTIIISVIGEIGLISVLIDLLK